jgi:hypothetical protein
MTKSTITQLFLGSVIAVIAGFVMAFAAIWFALANGALIMDGPDVVGIAPTAFAWTAFGLALVAALAITAGLIGGLVAWIGALINTARLEDKAWFVILLVLGLLSFGFVAMLAYVVSGPDGYQSRGQRELHAAA